MPGIGLGKSKGSNSSSSGNVNNGQLMSSMFPATAGAGQAVSNMGAELNGGPNGFADSGGFNFLLNKGTQAVNSDMSSRGLLNSGADMKGLEDYRGGLAQTYLNNYMQNNAAMGAIANGAGGILANSGDVSQSQGKSKSKNGSISAGGGG